MKSETWMAIEGHEGRYAVSDHGNVMSMNYAKSGLPGILRSYLRRGYPSVFLFGAEPKGKWFTVHSLVAAAFIGPRPKGAQINHKNGNKADPAAENLEYCTNSQNMKHAFATGLQSNRGERHSQAKLSATDVLRIRELLGSGVSQASVSKLMRVSPSCISLVNSRKIWAHISEQRSH